MLAEQETKLYLCALLNSFVVDSIIRYKISTTLNMFYIYQLPIPRLEKGNWYFDEIVKRAARLVCTREEYVGLWEEVYPDRAMPIPPTDEERITLRDEIDGLVAHLYGLSRSEFKHLLQTFPLVFPNTEAGQHRLEMVLAVYDEVGSV